MIDPRQLLTDDRLGRAHPDPDNAARSGESVMFDGPLGNYDTEPADSARLRSLLQPLFSPRRMRAIRPRVAALTDELLDALERSGPPADLHAGLAVPLPVLVICELLGVPYQDRDRFRRSARDFGDVQDRARSERGMKDLFEYGMELVARKRREPADDVISELCDNPELTNIEVAGLAMALLFAGHETTVVQLGLGALSLFTHAEQSQAMLDDPGLLRNAVEEILRATGQHIPFGQGQDYCIGAPLARIELEEAYSRLLQRFPTMRIAVPIQSLTIEQDTLTGGLTQLPVTW